VVYRAECAVSATAKREAWVAIDDGYVLHPQANGYLSSLRSRDRSVNTERVYAGRIALYLSYCEQRRSDWRAPTVEFLSGFLKYLVDEPLPPRVGKPRQCGIDQKGPRMRL
jgi:integrase/recombinase XerD